MVKKSLGEKPCHSNKEVEDVSARAILKNTKPSQVGPANYHTDSSGKRLKSNKPKPEMSAISLRIRLIRRPSSES